MRTLAAGISASLAIVSVALAAPDDIYVADPFSQPGFVPAVLRITPADGSQSVASSAGNFGIGMYGLARESSGNLVIATSNGAEAQLIRVNPADGTQSILSSGGEITDPRYLAIASNGDVILAEQSGKKVLRIDPISGAQSILASGPPLGAPRGIAIASNGDIYVSDAGSTQAVYRIPAAGGPPVPVTTNGFLSNVQGIELGRDGDLYVAEFNNKLVVRINLADGTQSKVAEGDPLSAPQDIAVAANGDLLVTDASAFASGAVIRIDPATGQQAPVAQAGKLQDPRGIDVEPTADVGPTFDVEISASDGQAALRTKGLLVDALCPTEACTVEVSGVVDVTGASTTKRFTLKQTSGSLTAGETATLKLKLPRKARVPIRRALRRGREVTSELTATATGAGGNVVTKTLQVSVIAASPR